MQIALLSREVLSLQNVCIEKAERSRGGGSGGGLITKSCPTLCDPMDYIARQAPLSMGFPRQEHWSELPFPSPGDLPDPGIEPRSPALQADSLPTEPRGKPQRGSMSPLHYYSI